jgi:hypothetical protein
MDAYPDYIIPRVLEVGTLDDWRLVQGYYGLSKIAEVCKRVRCMDCISLAFVCALTHTNKEDYRCYHISQSSPTPWNESTVEENHIRLASPVDIAAMKIYAAEGRGTRKDFVDLYFLLKHYTLSDLLKFYRDKYPEHSEFAAIRSLTYFEDAEKSPMPFMFAKDKWEHMKARISREVANYISKGITD